MKAIRIRMKQGCSCSNDLEEIDQIFLEGSNPEGFYSKASIYDYLMSHPNSIQVNIYPFPYLQPMLSKNGEKYVRSEPDYTGTDNLLKLPRE